VLDAAEPTRAPPRLVLPRRTGVEYFVNHGEVPPSLSLQFFALLARLDSAEVTVCGRGQLGFFIVTNAEGAENYKLMVSSDEHVSTPARWRTLEAHDSSVKIEDIDLFTVRLRILCP
jgi:protease II